jgi:hypothetical protein
MSKPTKVPAAVERLRALAEQPDEQARLALALLERERGIQVVSAALAVVLAVPPRPAARPILLRLYDHYDADGVKRDPGCDLRVAILTALQPLVQGDDAALAERALTTYEFLPPTRAESAGELRAAGLLLLAGLDPERARYHAVRLLVDPHTSRMSGRPAVDAVRLLADHGQTLPLYQVAVDPRGGVSEVIAACLQNLTAAPPSILAGLVAQYGESPDDLLLAGLFDLLVAHPGGAAHVDFLVTFLRTTYRMAAYRYLVTTILAARPPGLFAALLNVAETERDRRRAEILVAALDLVLGDPAIAALVAELRRRM